jgi:hypothetical protein
MSRYAAFARNVIQLGRETTPGIPVAANTVWRSKFSSLSDTEVQKIIDEQIGSLYGQEAVFTTMYGGELKTSDTPLTFEQIGHIFDAGWAKATPTGSGPYTRVYEDDPSASAQIATYTIEAGNFDAQADAQRMSYAFVSEWQIGASAGEEWAMSASWIGRQVVSNPLTSAVSVPEVQVAVLPMTRLYIDASGGTVGTTLRSGVLMGASIKRVTGWKPVPIGDGTKTYAAIKQVAPEATFSLTFELEQVGSSSLVASERAAWRSKVARLFRLHIAGEDSSHDLIIDWCGRYSSVGAYENADGNTTVTLEGRMVYTPVDNLFMRATLVNPVATY